MNDLHHDTQYGPLLFINSLVWSAIGWISVHNAQIMLTLIATAFAACSSVLAGRYYWYAAQEKKRSLKNLPK